MNRVMFILLTLMISGCDSHYGVVRKAQVGDFIDYKCIEKSLQSISEVSRVNYTFMGGNPEMAEAMKDAYARHRYHYSVDEIDSFVSVLTNSEGTEIVLFSTRNMLPPLQEDINKIRPVMDKVQIEISHHCNINKLSSSFDEVCTRVKCT